MRQKLGLQVAAPLLALVFAVLLSGVILQITDNDPGAVLRTHFHVPLYETGEPPLRSTAHALRDPAFAAALAENGCDQFEVETYTWNVWRQCAHSATDVDDGIARELAAAADIFPAACGK